MSNANPIPTSETLIRQVGRHLAMAMGINAAAPYIATPAGSSGFPRGVGLIDPEISGGPDGSDVFRGRGALWARSIPDAPAVAVRGNAAGFDMSLTAEAVPAPASGIDTPYRMIGVRFHVQAPARTTCVEVLSEVARVFTLPGYSSAGRRWWTNQSGMSAEALTALGGQSHGVIGVPPPESIGASGAPVWRVIGVEEYAPLQVLSDEIGAASGGQGGGVAGASGMVACTMTLAFMVVPAAVAAPTKAFEVWLPLGALPGVAGNDAAVRVYRAVDGLVKIETGQFVSAGAAHTYAVYSSSTVGGIVTAMGGAGWQFSSSVAGALARPAADLVLMDWRRARSNTGTGGATVKASVYVHGEIAPGGGGGGGD